MTSASVAIFDDNTHFLVAINILLKKTDYAVVGRFLDCKDLIQRLDLAKPDIILMDIDMPGINGIEAVKIIRKSNKTVRILMQSAFDDDDKIFKAILAGANGYILKSDISEKLIDALDDVSKGGTPLSSIIATKVFSLFQYLAQNPAQNPPQKTEYRLTKREKEILVFLVEGMSYKMVAQDLSISYETVHSHIKNIYKKLHVASMTEAVSKAIRERIV